jgi:hypothetical protein
MSICQLGRERVLLLTKFFKTYLLSYSLRRKAIREDNSKTE